MKKMTSRGWAYKRSDGSFQLRSFPHVWNTLGIVKTRRRKSKTYGYQYSKILTDIEVKPLDKQDLRSVVLRIRFHIADRKVRQFTHRLTKVTTGVSPRNTKKFRIASDDVKHNEKPMLSCEAVARMLGYKSATSGCKWYPWIFTKVPQERKVEIRYHEKTRKYAYLFPCNRISLV